MTYIYNGILDGTQAQEIAEDMNITRDEAAKTWFNAVIPDGEGEFGDMPAYHQFVSVLDGGEWDLYYDYGADYYFAVNDNYEED